MAIRFIGALTIEHAGLLAIQLKHPAFITIDEFINPILEGIKNVEYVRQSIISDAVTEAEKQVALTGESITVIGVVELNSILVGRKTYQHVFLDSGLHVPAAFQFICDEFWLPKKGSPQTYYIARSKHDAKNEVILKELSNGH